MTPKVAETDFKRPRLRGDTKLLWLRIINSWPFFVWICLILLTLYLYTRSRQYGVMVGEAEKITETVAPIQTARLKTLHVHIGDHVKAGQLIAEMDDSLPDAQFAATGAAVTEAELGLENNNQGGILTLIRSTEAATNDAIIVLNEQRLTQKRDEAELAQLKAIQKERDELFAMRLISAVEEDALKPQIAAIERSVAALPEIISAMEQHLAETAKQEKGLRRNLRIGENQDASLTVDQQISAHTDVLKSDLKVRQVQKDFYRLYATREGVVSQIDVYPGNIVQAGGRIVELVAEKPTRIIGYLPELRFNSVNPGNKGYAFHQWGIIGTGTGKPMKVTVQAIAPEIETLPPNVGANTSMQTMRIRRIIFTIDEENSFVAGETIQIRMTMPFSVLVRNVFGL